MKDLGNFIGSFLDPRVGDALKCAELDSDTFCFFSLQTYVWKCPWMDNTFKISVLPLKENMYIL